MGVKKLWSAGGCGGRYARTPLLRLSLLTPRYGLHYDCNHTMNSKYTYEPVDARVSFPEQEERILAFWEREKIFERSVSQRDGRPEYVFYDGPPFATGLPHFGHFVPGTIKDIFPRYHTMCGKRVERRFGWDCHGLPVEYEVEKELDISGKAAIEQYGVARFNEKCRSIVLRYTKEWQQTVTRMGRWVDFANDYKTMDPQYMESIWWVFKELWQRDYIYHGYYILPYSAGLATPLSNFEVNLGGYHDVDDPALTVRFALRPTEQSAALGLPSDGCAFIAWTTTPWTLPSNLGLAVGDDIEYALVRDGQGSWIVAAELVARYWPASDAHTIAARFRGRDLAGLAYEPLFPYFADLARQGAFTVRAADFVATDEGTGIVHLAPAFGEDDYRLFKDSGLPIEMVLDDQCRFTDRIAEYSGLFVKDADARIIDDLKARGAVVRHEQYRHSYPFCWRTKEPLIYRAIDSWFVNIERIKERMVAANGQIDWMPRHIQDGRFGRWLESARDWAISRNRYWGNPIPIWKSDGGDYMECIGSIAELEQKSGETVSDLHKHYIDHLTWDAPDGSGTMRRIPEVLDCWFESGAMPYAQNHYPFENRAHFEGNFTADFICEGIDQTRGWFYTLTVLSAALFDKPPSRNIVVSGLVLDANGRKMSKSERNYSDPRDIIDNYGADALRLFLMRSPVVKADDLKYSDDGVRDALRQIIIPLWNAYSFFVTYANIDGVRVDDVAADGNSTASDNGAADSVATDAANGNGAAGGDGTAAIGAATDGNGAVSSNGAAGGDGTAHGNPFDLWLYSECQRLIATTRAHMDGYDLQRAVEPIIEFIDNLNNWYIRRSRRRFWSSGRDHDKMNAYVALRHALLTLIQVAAPFIPFITEVIYQNIRQSSMPTSVHLCDYPVVEQQLRNRELERKMRLCLQAVHMGRTLRKNHSLKNRQPLSALYIVSGDADERKILSQMKDIIADELNIKQVHIADNEREYVDYSVQANFRALGKQLGANMNQAAQKIARLTDDDIAALLSGEAVSIEVGGASLALTADSVLVRRTAKGSLKVLNDGSLTAIVDPQITEQLRQEGVMRDIIRLIQRTRKSAGFEISDTIAIRYAADDRAHAIIGTFRDAIMAETLTKRLERVDASVIGGGGKTGADNGADTGRGSGDNDAGTGSGGKTGADNGADTGRGSGDNDAGTGSGGKTGADNGADTGRGSGDNDAGTGSGGKTGADNGADTGRGSGDNDADGGGKTGAGSDADTGRDDNDAASAQPYQVTERIDDTPISMALTVEKRI